MKALLNVNCGRSLVSPYRVVSLRLFKRQNNALFPPFASDPDQDVINENHTPNYSYDHYPSSRQLVPTNNVNPSTPPSITNESADPERGNIDVILRNRMITRHIRMGDLDSALRLFNNMDVKSTVTWNSLLAGYSKQRGKLVEARQLFDKIPKPDIISYNTLLSCFVRSSDLNAAKTFFDQMPIRDTASWNTMITGFADKGMMSEALSLFMEMPVRNSVSWNAMISGYIESGDLDSALKMFRDAPIRNEVAWTAIISGYMKSGEVDIAEKYYEQMRVKSLVTYNCMISGYVSNCRAEDGLKLFRRMVGCGIRPNPSTMSSVLLGCSCLSALSLGTQIHPFLYKSLLYHDTTVGTSLLSMYCKCGVLEDAWKLFLEMPRWDLATWNAIISGYAHHGAGKRALSLFDQMKVEKVEPDWITFVGVLAACNHAGLVDVGVHYFETMGRDHGIETKPEHYTCMVDLLGRAGKLNEAVDLVKKMPIEPSAATLGALLSACRIHKNLELAEFAAKRLVDLNPSNSAAAYVQLSNLYRTMNRWDQTATLHKHMRRSKLEKIPGYSWIEIKSVVHEFTSGDTLHPDMPSIHRKLQELEQKMILAGYKPDLECVLHDVDEKQKKELLLCHSEKLAIAFGVMRLPQGSPIRIFKNLRVCADCHNATKYISAIEGREIIVRDSRRFHHFSNGSCSCGDYW